MEETTEAIIQYVEQPKTAYALMLTGEWGSGKTYYWENILSLEIKKITCNDQGEKSFIPLYVSLNGITNVKELEESIFYEVFFNYKYVNGTLDYINKIPRAPEFTKMVTGVGNKVLNHRIGVSLKDLKTFPKVISTRKNIVLCIDDIERSSLTVYEIFSYLNKYIEHDNMKILFLTDESKIHKKEETYYSMKEKVVGKTILYEPDSAAIIETIISSYDDPLYSWLSTNKDMILNTIKESGNENFRILQHCLEDYARLYSFTIGMDSIDQHLKSNYLRDQLKFIIVCAIETKTNSDGVDFFNSLETHIDFQRYHFSEKGEKNRKINYYKNKIENRYDTFVFFKSTQQLITVGLLKKDIIHNEIQTRVQYSKDKKSPARILLEGYWTLSDREFVEELDKFYLALIDGEIKLSYYLNAMELLIHLYEKKLLNKTPEQIYKDLSEGLNKVESSGEPFDLDNNFNLNFNYHDEKVNKYYSEIKTKINLINNKIGKNQIKNRAESLFELIPDYQEEFMKSLFYDNNITFSSLFAEVSSNEIYKKIIQLDNYYLAKLKSFFKNRYKENGHFIKDQSLDKELQNMNQVKEMIIRQNSNSNKLSSHLLLELFSVIPNENDNERV